MSVDVNIARNTLPCWCVIMLALVIRSVIPYQWFLSHCDPSHTNAPLTPTLSLLAASALWLFEAPLVCVVGLSDLTGGSGDCFDYVVLRPALLCAGLIQLLEINSNSAVVSPAVSCKPWLTSISNYGPTVVFTRKSCQMISVRRDTLSQVSSSV